MPIFVAQMKEEIKQLRGKVKELERALGLSERTEALKKLEAAAVETGFWDDAKAAQKTLKEIDAQKSWVEAYREAEKSVADGEVLIEMLEEGADPELSAELKATVESATRQVSALELKKMLGGEDDSCDAIVEIHSGAGGTESQDWAQMLMRMYSRYFEDKGYESAIIDILTGEEGGLKTVAMEVKGKFAFGYLKAENGIHRLVRISPFDSNSRRHTSFASVHVLPIIEFSSTQLNDADLRVDTYRASGAGGQHVNKTDSAVRMTHLPTGIVAQCQSERSQLKNREYCTKLLQARVAQHYREEEEKKRDAKAAEKKKIEWGSQIRSYVLHPYNMVKDHRTQVETANTESVLDGNLDPFIKAFLLKK